MRRVLAILASVAFSCMAAHADDQELPDGPNRALVYGKCRTCHDLQYLRESAGITRDDWEAQLDSMRTYGLRLTPDEHTKILEYLGTYLGPNPPPAQSASNATSTGAAAVDGAKVYAEQCAACHQPNGQGVAGQFPPLAGNRDLFLDKTYALRVVLFGIEGAISVGDHTYEAAMPPFGHLSDAEVAAVVSYVRGAWGNDTLKPGDMGPATEADAKAARATAMTSGAVHDYRKKRQVR
jgi:mono/diheme cytochrome c family protein